MRENTIVKQTSLNMKYNAKTNVWCTSIEKKIKQSNKKSKSKLETNLNHLLKT